MTGVEIRLGDRWQADVAHLSRVHASRGDPADINLINVRDVIDIVLGEDNITAPIDRDSIFPVMVDLLGALESLLSARRRKSAVLFHEAPWELILVRDGEHALVSLLDTGPHGRVALHNRPVALTPLVQESVAVANDMVDALLGIHPRFDAHPLLRRLQNIAHRLPSLLTELCADPTSAPPTQKEEQGRASAGELLVQWRLDVGFRDVVGYQGEDPMDLHALLAPGRVRLLDTAIQGEATQHALGGDYPVLTVRRLLDDLEHIVQRLENGAPLHLEPPRRSREVRLLTAAPVGEPWTDPWTLRWQPAPSRRQPLPGAHATAAPMTGGLRKAQPAPVYSQATLHELAQLCHSLADALSHALLDSNPRLSQEERLNDLRQATGQLLRRVRERGAGDRRLEDPDAHLLQHTGARLISAPGAPQSPQDAQTDPPQRDVSSPFAWRSLRRVGVTQRWSLHQANVRWDQLSVHHEALWVPGEAGLSGWDLHSGQRRFWHPWRDSPRPSMAVGGGRLFILSEDGRLQTVDPVQGAALWSTRLPGGGCGALLGAAGVQRGDERKWVLMAQRATFAFDERGELCWRQRHEAGHSVGGVVWPSHVALMFDGGLAMGLDPQSGRTLWRTTLEGGRSSIIGRRGETLWVGVQTGSPAGMRMLALDALTGQARWSRGLPGRPVRAPLHMGPYALLMVRGATRCWLVTLDARSGEARWRRRMPSSRGASPATPIGDPRRGVVWVKTARGVVLALRVEGGELLWQCPVGALNKPPIHNTPLTLHQNVLVTATDALLWLSPEDGELLHRVEGLPEHPHWWEVTAQGLFLSGEQGLDGDEDTLYGHAVSHFLTPLS